MSEKVLGFLNQQKSQSRSGLPQHYAAFEDLYDRKLWHQLTQSIHEFIRLGDFREGDELLQLYHNFISDFEKKISPLSLAQFALAASKQMQDRKEAIQFLNSIAEKVDKSVETHVLVVMETAAFQLATGDVAGCKKAIEESEKKLDALSGVEPTIHASFYRVYSSFDQFRGNYDGYYKNSLLYLACVNLDSLNQEEKIERTYNLAIAALLGESIYNFGELLAHEILEVLRGTKYEWLIDLLKVFNTGDIQKFEENKHVLQMDPLLSSSLAFLEQKIRLMGLIEILFKLSGQKRNMYFGDIAQGTKLNEDQVEHLLMKAMSLKLVRGVIDQVSAEVNITWVHPRVLDKSQMESLRAKLASWSEAVSSTVDTMHADSPELFAQ